MFNLEELILYLFIKRIEPIFIDGTHLHKQILIHLEQLNHFQFSISTIVNNDQGNSLPSNDVIQRSFIDCGKQQIGSYVNRTSSSTTVECRIYSIPYYFDTFLRLNNSFPGGKFNRVRTLMMSDRHPFEQQFFRIIAQDFPFLRKLFVLNLRPQTNKELSSRLLTFPHLIELQFNQTHRDYVELFLHAEKTSLPRLSNLIIEYSTLAIVTDYFTNDGTRSSCAQLQNLHLRGPFVPPDNFYSYFSSL